MENEKSLKAGASAEAEVKGTTNLMRGNDMVINNNNGINNTNNIVDFGKIVPKGYNAVHNNIYISRRVCANTLLESTHTAAAERERAAKEKKKSKSE
jgi:hypothetical protein